MIKNNMTPEEIAAEMARVSNLLDKSPTTIREGFIVSAHHPPTLRLTREQLDRLFHGDVITLSDGTQVMVETP